MKTEKTEDGDETGVSRRGAALFGELEGDDDVSILT